MTRFIADKYYAVPKYFEPLFALNIKNPFDEDAPDSALLLFHPQVNFKRGLIINSFVATALGVKEGDDVRFTLVGTSGGTFKLPKWKVGKITGFFPGAPFLNVSAGLLRAHFDFDPDYPLHKDSYVEVNVHGGAGTCGRP